MIVAATGHRPDKLGGYGDDTRIRLRGLARSYLADLQITEAVSGMALGWDQAFAEAAIELSIPLTAAVPFEGQERRWPADSRKRYSLLIAKANAVHVVSPYPGIRAMQLRNEWMVDRADRVCALWDGSWGGTFNALQYARKIGRPCDNLWTRWANDLTGLL